MRQFMQSRADAAVWPLCPRSLGNRTNWRERGIRVGEHGADGAEAQVACPRVARSKVLAYGMALVLFMLAHLRRPGEKYRYAGAHGSMQGLEGGCRRLGAAMVWGQSPWSGKQPSKVSIISRADAQASASSHAPLHLITPRQVSRHLPKRGTRWGQRRTCGTAASVQGEISARLFI